MCANLEAERPFLFAEGPFSLNSATLCFISCNSAATFFSLNLALELHCFRATDLFLVSFVVSPQQPSVLMLEGHAHHAAVNSGFDDLDSRNWRCMGIYRFHICCLSLGSTLTWSKEDKSKELFKVSPCWL